MKIGEKKKKEEEGTKTTTTESLSCKCEMVQKLWRKILYIGSKLSKISIIYIYMCIYILFFLFFVFVFVFSLNDHRFFGAEHLSVKVNPHTIATINKMTSNTMAMRIQ